MDIHPTRNKKHLPIKDRSGRPVIEKAYLWLSARKDHPEDASSSARVHVPLHDASMDVSRVAITEGEVKADIATWVSGILHLSVPGVASWRLGLDQAKALGAEEVVLAYDADADTNSAVGDAVIRSFETAPEMGMIPLLQTWPKSGGKGIDDVLVKDRAAAQILEGDAAEVFVERLARKHELRTRLQDKGAAALSAVRPCGGRPGRRS